MHYGGRHSTDATGTVRIEAEVGTWPLTKVTPGHRLDEEIPAADWTRAAREVGRELEGHARRIDVETVVVAGERPGPRHSRPPASSEPALRPHVTTVQGAGESAPGWHCWSIVESLFEALGRA